jgi:hypothetical protein
MNIALSPALRRFVDSQVASGRYLDAGDVVRASLRRMEAQDIALGLQRGGIGDRDVISTGAGTYPNLGAMGDGDIMALAFIVMMEAAKSAREDLKSIMDGVKAINKEKDGWRSVMDTVNKLAAACAGKRDDFNAKDMGDAIPRGPAARIAHKPVGSATLAGNKLVFNTPAPCGATVAAGLTIAGTGQPGGYVTKKDIDSVKDTVRNKLDSLSEMGEMESLRLQMAMDRISKLMSTLSDLLKRASETASAITQNIK